MVYYMKTHNLLLVLMEENFPSRRQTGPQFQMILDLNKQTNKLQSNNRSIHMKAIHFPFPGNFEEILCEIRIVISIHLPLSLNKLQSSQKTPKQMLFHMAILISYKALCSCHTFRKNKNCPFRLEQQFLFQ